jgi:hypothetical protein
MVKKAFRYVKSTKNYMLTHIRFDSLEIRGYSDADSAGDKNDRKSTSGYVFTLARGKPKFCVAWRLWTSGKHQRGHSPQSL